MMCDVIVAMSGNVEVDNAEEKTAGEVLAEVKEKIGVDNGSVEGSFVVVHTKSINHYRVVEKEERIGDLSDSCVVRAILPLVGKNDG